MDEISNERYIFKGKVLMFNLKVNLTDETLEFAINWVKEIAERCEHVDLITLEYSGEFIANNVSVFSLGKERGDSKMKQLLNLYQIVFSLLLKNEYSFCFSHMNPLFIAFTGFFIRLKQIEIITWYAHRNASFPLRVGMFFSNKIISINEHSFPLITDKLFELGHGINLNLYKRDNLTKRKDEKTLLFVGRLSKIKQVEIIIKAVEILLSKSFLIKLYIIGDKSNVDDSYVLFLKKLVVIKYLDKSVFFIGRLSNKDTVPYYQNCFAHINCSPSNHSVDKTILEAMACGSLSLSSVLAAKETMGIYSNKLIFEDKNEIDLANKLEYWLKQDDAKIDTVTAYLYEKVHSMHSLKNLVNKLFLIGQ